MSLAVMCSAFSAEGHARIGSAEPPADAVLTVPPPAIAITFTEKIEPWFSAIEIRNEKGERVGGVSAQTVSDRTLSIAPGHLDPGKYTVTWRVLSVDTHKSEGTYAFTITP